MVAFRVAFLLVAGASAWTRPEMAAPATLPTTPNKYTLHDETECMASGKANSILFDKYSGGTPTIGDCVKRCESMTGCIGFAFYYGKNFGGVLLQDFKCIGISLANTCTAPTFSDLKAGRNGNLAGRKGISFFTRDAGAVEAGQEASRLPWQGDAPQVTDAKFLPFAGMDCMGDDDGELFAAKTNHTPEECMTACKARTTCAGFNYVFKDDSSMYQRCVGKKKDKCSLVGGREGSVYYADTTTTGKGTVAGAVSRGTANIVVVAVVMLLAAVQL